MFSALRAASSRILTRASPPLALAPRTTGPGLPRTFASSTAAMPAKRDPSTLSNYAAWLTRHTTTSLTVDFDSQSLKGRVDYDIVSRTAKESREIVLDTSHLSISSISIGGAKAQWELRDRHPALGTPLHIAVPEGAAEGDVLRLSIELQTTAECTALQWLAPAQTSNKKHPYMFSQCQAIHARSLFPCQDTPDVKSTYTFSITSPLSVIASGILAKETLNTDDVTTTYVFEQRVPIPSYLFALASGDIATAQIGSRSKVATGPEELHDAKWELERDIEKFIEVAEKLVFPYKWGEYNVLVLPPSFPYGGMENPVYTFATPTLISGDRQNVDVIAHELAHSWSGNLVTSCSWEHFWLNEGWTIYLERRIGAAIHGEPERDFSAIIGWKALEDSINHYGADHEYTKLIPNLQDGVDPDDAFSTVPYEKGFHFLYYLEKLVGRDTFDKFIPHYFTKYSEKSLDSFEFKETFISYFNGLGDAEIAKKVAGIDWEGRFYTPGLPPKPEFDTTYADQCYALAEKWKDPSFKPSAADIEHLNGSQRLVFLETVQSFDTPLPAERVRLLGATYDLLASKNVDLQAAYYHVALAAGDESCRPGVADLLGRVGRMKFVRPLFRGLNKADRGLAVRTYEANRDFYHPICRAMVAKDLGVE